MADQLQLIVRSRTVLGKKNKALRERSSIPGVVYGQGKDNLNIEVPLGTFTKLFTKAGESSLIDLVVDEADPVAVLVHDVQRDPVQGTLSHVDFYRVNMHKKVSAVTPIVFHGESSAVKEQGGVLVKTLDHVTIECLPKDLVHELVIDISRLVNVNDALHVSDLAIPAGVTIQAASDTMVVSVQPPRTEEQEVAAPVLDVSQVEVEKKGKTEEAEAPAEGSAKS